jgi:hypothetical protein
MSIPTRFKNAALGSRGWAFVSLLATFSLWVLRTLLEDRLVGWANEKIDQKSGVIMEFVAPIVKHLAIAPVGYVAVIGIVMIVAIFIHAYINEGKEKTHISDEGFDKKPYYERENLQLFVIAYLSLGLEPQRGEMPAKVNSRNGLLKDSINTGKLKSIKKSNVVNANTMVTIKDFKLFAENSNNPDIKRVYEEWVTFHPSEQGSEFQRNLAATLKANAAAFGKERQPEMARPYDRVRIEVIETIYWRLQKKLLPFFDELCNLCSWEHHLTKFGTKVYLDELARVREMGVEGNNKPMEFVHFLQENKIYFDVYDLFKDIPNVTGLCIGAINSFVQRVIILPERPSKELMGLISPDAGFFQQTVSSFGARVRKGIEDAVRLKKEEELRL